MKPKVIAIVIAVVITAGTATGVGVAVSRNNDKQTEELISAAVSEALATVESTTAESTTESTTAESTTAKNVQKALKQEATTVEETTTEEPSKGTGTKTKKAPEIIKNNDEVSESEDTKVLKVNTPIGTISKSEHNKRQDDLGYYWLTNYTYIPNPNSGTYYHYCLDENDKIFYFDKNNNRVYPDFEAD